MICAHFGACGSCSLHAFSYEEQFAYKKARLFEQLHPFGVETIKGFASQPAHYRNRAEFKIYHEADRCFYAMRHLDDRTFVRLRECSMVAPPIVDRMWKLLDLLNNRARLRERLFGVEFLSATTGELLATLLYHRKLDDAWAAEAENVAVCLDMKIIGRSRKQKLVLDEEFVTESLRVGEETYRFRYYEQGFSQPNGGVNVQMIGWVKAMLHRFKRGDFCELYAGAGNFSIPLASLFEQCLATEISKRSIRAARENLQLNDIGNVHYVRMSSEEFSQALGGARPFRRLAAIDLERYCGATLLVDPPRAGLDETTLRLAATFATVVYISCNPETLARDLDTLCRTHNVQHTAMFDQFPYTPHTEAGVVLVKK